MHPNVAKGIASTGFDDCSTASNFAADKGLAGVRRTISALHSAGVNHAGTQGSRRAPRIAIHTVNGIRVAHLSYTDPGDSPGVKGAPWAINRQSPGQIAKDAAHARKAGAEIVIVSLAMGSKNAKGVSARQQRAVRTITAGHNVDYIIGHGSHTVQPASLVNGTWVVWHGNVLASFFPNEARMRTGVISDVTFTQVAEHRFAVSSIAFSAVQSVNGSIRALDMANASCWQVSGYRSSQAMNARAEAAAARRGLWVNGACSQR